ncbi:PqqD family protein [Streptococcus sp.]
MLNLNSIVQKNVSNERPYLKSLIINNQFSLNEVGKLIFIKIDGHKTVEDIVYNLMEEVDNDDFKEVSEDVLEFLENLLENGFIVLL